MPAYHKAIAAAMIILTLLVGCGQAQPTATPAPAVDTPTAVPAAPTNTPLPPADTPTTVPAAPTDTPLPPTDTPTAVPAAPTDTPVPTDTPEPMEAGQRFLLEGVGFRTPESVLYDPEADLYLVANINGDPRAKDGNGFVSQVSPEGELVALKWIDGAAEGVTLNAPKGMALFGDRLFVADIDVVRVFDRHTGDSLDEIAIAGASFLNDVAAAEDGTIYVTDSAVGAIHRIAPDGSVEQLAQGSQLGGPNGIQVRGETIMVAAYGSGQVYELGDDGLPTAEREVPAGGLDGLVLLDDGTILVSSWDGSAVYRFDSAGKVSELFGGIPAPADIGFDTERGYVLIPHFNNDRVEARPLPQ